MIKGTSRLLVVASMCYVICVGACGCVVVVCGDGGGGSCGGVVCWGGGGCCGGGSVGSCCVGGIGGGGLAVVVCVAVLAAASVLASWLERLQEVQILSTLHVVVKMGVLCCKRVARVFLMYVVPTCRRTVL